MSSSKEFITNPIDMGFTRERFPLGTHMCYLYNDEQERRQAIAAYINAGLAAGDCVGYFADLDAGESVSDYLRDLGLNLPEPLPPELGFWQRSREVYCPGDRFVPAGMLAKIRALQTDCWVCQQRSLRVAGEMAWAAAPEIAGLERLVEYEARVNLLMETHPFAAICQYNASQFDGALLFELVKVHPLMVVRGQIVRNSYYIPAREYLGSRGLPIAG